MHLSLVIPCYNEEESLPALFSALDGAVEDLIRRGHTVEVIIVDDGSRDRSAQLLREATTSRPWLQAIRLSRNFGQTAALAAGFSEATGEVIIPLDADMQNDPMDIPLLLSKLEEGFDVVSGWRHRRQDARLTRILPSAVANWLISRVSGVALHDYGCTLKAYRREVLRDVHLYGEMHRFIPIYAAWHGARVTEIPVRHHPRRAGKTKYGLGRVPRVLLDLLWVRFFWFYGTRPLHAFGMFGLLNIGLALLCFLLMVWFKYWGGKTFIQTPLPQLVVTLFGMGCLSILMGFLAEILMRTYHEAAGQPTFVVRERYLNGQAQPAGPLGRR
ncbi:MAG: glycosyltransferase family 2 protein [Myxococcales bacterium]|nr:glycosyltransferase family 2 protein [Myxococcota bacterium]MDW8281075.1 glycosyltransferase family 2 protein [Myxococcales bacterium]